MIKKFFECFADYARKENDISDITVALCKANPTFKKTFVKFFFNNNIDINANIEIKREVPSNDGQSRVDIMIEVEGDEKPYLIEVKKYDENHHFEQYVKAYNITPDRLGYITNYELKKEGEYQIKKWKEFYEVLTNEDEVKNDGLIQAYAQYLDKVCYINYDKKIELSNNKTEDDFRRIIEDIITSSPVLTEFHKKYPDKYAYGFFFSNPNEIIDHEKGGYGVFYFKKGENPEISIVIHARETLEVQILSGIQDDGMHFIKPHRQEVIGKTNVMFKMKETTLNKIKKSGTYPEQRQLLKEFYEEVMTAIKKLN